MIEILYLHPSGLLEEVTTRLDDILAEVLKQHGAQIFGGLLALLKQLLSSQSIGQCSEAIESSVKRHLEYWGEVSVHLHQSLVLLLLLTVVVGNVASRQLLGEEPRNPSHAYDDGIPCFCSTLVV